MFLSNISEFDLFYFSNTIYGNDKEISINISHYFPYSKWYRYATWENMMVFKLRNEVRNMMFGSDIPGEQAIKWDVLINVEM